jgi:hypothetical protein
VAERPVQFWAKGETMHEPSLDFHVRSSPVEYRRGDRLRLEGRDWVVTSISERDDPGKHRGALHRHEDLVFVEPDPYPYPIAPRKPEPRHRTSARGRRGIYANRLEALAKRARATHLGLWGVCPHTPYSPYASVTTRR